MKSLLYPVLALGLACGAAAPGHCGQRQAGPRTTIAVSPVPGTVMDDDIYIEIKAHEAAFLAAAFKGKMELAQGTMAQKEEFARLAEKKEAEFAAIRRDLLAGRRLSVNEYDDFEAALVGAGASQVEADRGQAGIKTAADAGRGGFGARERRITEGILRRAAELEAQGYYR